MSNTYAEAPHRFFDGVLTRKPSDWDDCNRAAVLLLPEPVCDWLATLSKHRFPSNYKPLSDFPEGSSITRADKPRHFIADIDGRQYLVATEGYGYCRYAVRLSVV